MIIFQSNKRSFDVMWLTFMKGTDNMGHNIVADHILDDGFLIPPSSFQQFNTRR
jgi:hypothetical protein